MIVTSRLDMCRREFVSDDCNRGTAGKLDSIWTDYLLFTRSSYVEKQHLTIVSYWYLKNSFNGYWKKAEEIYLPYHPYRNESEKGAINTNRCEKQFPICWPAEGKVTGILWRRQ